MRPGILGTPEAVATRARTVHDQPSRAVRRQQVIDQAARTAGRVLCWCNRWFDPNQLDDLGTCGQDACRAQETHDG